MAATLRAALPSHAACSSPELNTHVSACKASTLAAANGVDPLRAQRAEVLRVREGKAGVDA